MSKITLDNLSDNLKAYLEGLGLSEEQVVELLTDALSDVNGYLFNKTVRKYKDCYYSKEFVLNNTGVINNVHVYGNTVVNILSRYIDNANIVGDGNFIWLGEGHQYDLTNGVFTIINKSLVSDVNIQLKMVSDGSDFEGNAHAIDKNSYKIIDVPEGQCISTFYNSLKDEDLIDFVKNNIIILRGEYSSEFIENIEKIPTMISVGGSSEFIQGLRFNNLSKNGILINTDFTNNDILEGNLVDNEYCKLSDFIPVDYNNFIEVCIDNSYEYEMQYYVYDERYNYKGGTNWVNFFKHHIVSENGFIRVAVRRKDGDVVNINPSIIKFDTNYYLNLPGMLLHSLPNGIRDEILKVSNNYYLIRRCGFIKLNGEENWEQVYLKDKCIRCMVPVDNLMRDTDNVICESDKLLATSNALWEKDEPHIDIDGSSININLPLDLLETADYNGFIKYLKENNVCVVYGLNKPYVELISNIDFYTHDGDNEFIIETYGMPIKFDFDVNTSLEEEMIVAKEKLITLENKVNELFQSANNGKELIANAIGEPVSADDTFSAMSDKINDMKSDLKQVLTDEGVSVNNEDSIASLIAKVDGEFSDKKQSIVDVLIARGVEASIDEDFNTLVGKIQTVGLISLVPGTSGTYLITHFSKNISCSGSNSVSCEGEINIDTSKFKLDGVSINISSGTGLNIWYSVTQYRNGALYKTHINGEYVSEVNKINKTLSVYDVQQGDIFRLSKTGNGSSLDFRGTSITVTSIIAL